MCISLHDAHPTICIEDYTLVSITTTLKLCDDIALQETSVWQRACKHTKLEFYRFPSHLAQSLSD